MGFIFLNSSRMTAFLVVLFVSSSLFSLTASKKKDASFEGTATFYKDPPYTKSACFEGKSEGVLVGAASDKIWDGGKICGKKFKVHCTGGTNDGPHPCKKGKSASVTIEVIDFCKDCEGTIDLSEESFEKIANTDAGKVKIKAEEFDLHPYP